MLDVKAYVQAHADIMLTFMVPLLISLRKDINMDVGEGEKHREMDCRHCRRRHCVVWLH